MSVKIDLEDVADWLVMLSSIDGQISPREERLLALFEDTHGLRPGLFVAMAQKKAQAAEKEVQLVDRNISRGYDFEKFVVRMLCGGDNPAFTLLSWRSDKKVDGIFARDSLMPDLKVASNTLPCDGSVLVECKYRQDPLNLTRISEKALSRYQIQETECGCPVVLALGAGGSPGDPDFFTIVPIDRFINDKKYVLNRSEKLSREESTELLHRIISEFER